MELSQVKYLFKNYRRFKQSIKNLNDKLEVLRSQAAKVTASYGGTGGSAPSGNTSKIEAKIDKISEIEDNIKGFQQMVDVADSMLASLKSHQRALVTEIYINGRTFEAVANDEDMSLSNLHKIIDKTMKQLKDF